MILPEVFVDEVVLADHPGGVQMLELVDVDFPVKREGQSQH